MRLKSDVIALLMVFLISVSTAQSPPFRTVTITGKVESTYNKVSLFESGKSNMPLKTIRISGRDRSYSIDVEIPDDMRKSDDYYFTDMRFWRDKNNNGIKDSGEPRSECHFIIWIPAEHIVYMQVYEGPNYLFKTSTLKYNYE